MAALVPTLGEPTWIEGMSLYRTAETTEPLGGINKPTLALVLQGAKRSVLGERVYDYYAGQYLVVTLDLPLVSHIVEASSDRPFIAFGMPLQAELIASLLIEAGGRTQRRSANAGPALAVSTADDDFLDTIARLLRLHRQPTDYRILAPGIVRELHWRLLTGAQGEVIRQIGVADSALNTVAEATRWIRQNFDQAMQAEALAARVGVSVATLNRHFRTATGLSPLQYQKTVRLQHARLALLADPSSIARVGHAVGYQSLSQFSREYRRMFGAPPSAE